ncbi:MAG: TolC family protein [Deltaproteobacteria bacterium]|nr:TolC family protein [Deltaproteobacteria bacterium]MBM4338787.1 TolC family protein [Deltaproteobacteria bacterium]
MKVRWCVGLILVLLLFTGVTWAQESQKPLTLEESIKIALERNLRLHSSMEGVAGAEFRRRAAQTDFFAKWTGQYAHTYYNSPTTIGSGVSGSGAERSVYNLGTTVNQPLFAGGSIRANYRNEKLGVDISKTDVETVKRDIVLQAREGYFDILRAEKFLDVARQTVKQFSAQLEVTKAFFEVGIVPKNDVLQAEVRLANARQGLVRAENDVVLTKSSFNSLLRNDINAPLQIIDILGYSPFPLQFEDSLKEALERRPEIKGATLRVEQAKEGVKIAKSGFFPTINLFGNYSRFSEEPSLMGDLRSERWTIQTLATITLGDWGKTGYRVGESKVRVSQSEDFKVQLIEGITLEVKNNYQTMLVAEKNISVAEKAIEQAEENLRMNEERYKHQVATATDVLDAVTLLAQARVNYYGALSDFNVVKARLERSMGRIYP